MDYFDIPAYIQETVHSSLREQGKDDNTNLDSFDLLLENDESGQGSCHDFIETLQDLNESDLCAKFGLDIIKLRSHFENLVPKVLSILNFFQTGHSDVLPKNLNSATILNNNGLADKIEQPNNMDISTMLKILIMLHEKFDSSLLFSKNKLIKFQYFLDWLGLIKINFDSNDLQILITEQISLEPFTTIRIKFHLKCYVRQMIILKILKNWKGLAVIHQISWALILIIPKLFYTITGTCLSFWNPIQGLEI